MRVLAFDKDNMPRYKPCGGAFRQMAYPRHLYSRFLNHEGLGRWTDEKVHGHMIPIHLGGPVQVHHHRFLLIGDAARLVDPFLGEGIYYAIKSAHIASHALVDTHAAAHAGDLYTQRLKGTVRDLQTSLKIARMLYCFPPYAYYLFKTCPELVSSYFNVLCGDLKISEFYRALRRTALSNALRSISWLRDIQYRIPVVTGPRSQIRSADFRQEAAEQKV
jgi:flavin-dependent dehydrogenase